MMRDQEIGNNKDEDISNYQKIRNDYDERSSQLGKRIDNIEIQQQSIVNYISHIEQTVDFVDNQISIESNKQNPDYNRIKNLRTVLSKNIEILNDLHNSYKEYENVKFRYFKEINDNNTQKHKLVEIELRRLDDKLETHSADNFVQMMQMLINNMGNSTNFDRETTQEEEDLLNQAKEEIPDDPSYQL